MAARATLKVLMTDGVFEGFLIIMATKDRGFSSRAETAKLLAP